jgi:predicted glycogen debranching enzyme
MHEETPGRAPGFLSPGRATMMPMEAHRVGRAVTGDLATAESREWLVTNGRGGYASGTVAGSLTRRYHGLLVAALTPPVGRRLVVATCEIDVDYDGMRYELGTNRWTSGAVSPDGYRLCSSFALVDGVPTWTYVCGDAVIEKSIAMVAGADASALALRIVRARTPVTLGLRILAADRDHHGGALPDPASFTVRVEDDCAHVVLPESNRTLTIYAPGAQISAACERYAGFALPREAERGLTATDDYVHVASVSMTLGAGDSGGCVFTIDPNVAHFAPAVVIAARDTNRSRATKAGNGILGELAVAADAFIVKRGDGAGSGCTVVAGYHWFADWGRDTMIALPGLALATGRADVARDILLTFAKTVDGGMLPNRFPDDGAPPEYNTVDAALWFIEAVRAYYEKTSDRGLLDEIFAKLDEIVTGYAGGTRYGIHVDADGLVSAGVPGVQLTWMDAKVGDYVVTPRIGKPVEISALWYAALRAMETFAAVTGRPAQHYHALAERCAAGFARFWNPERDCCFDVLDGPNGNDAAIRPNQLFALALHASPLSDAHARAIVDVCSRELLTTAGLRTLAPGDPAYVGHYGGDQSSRDAAYHQGTVWPWLMGPFVRAHLRVYRDPAIARTFVQPLVDALDAYGIGTLGEIFDGDAPHAPRGTIAQAWSVAELITTLTLLAS